MTRLPSSYLFKKKIYVTGILAIFISKLDEKALRLGQHSTKLTLICTLIVVSPI